MVALDKSGKERIQWRLVYFEKHAQILVWIEMLFLRRLEMLR